MKISVISFTGKSIDLEVKPLDTIAKVKGEIEEKMGIPLCWQSLFYDSTRLEDDDMLFQRNVKANAKFDMVLEKPTNREPLACGNYPAVKTFKQIRQTAIKAENRVLRYISEDLAIFF